MISLIATIALLSCKAHIDNSLPLSEFAFNGVFGVNKNDSTTMYWIAYGWRYGGYKEDSFISDWVNRHPKANVCTILSMNEHSTVHSQIRLCWIMDKYDTLNTYLAKNGSIAGGLMIYDTSDAFFKPGRHDDYDVKILIDDKTYNRYTEQLKNAEQYARDHKYGIWANGDWNQDTRAHFFGK